MTRNKEDYIKAIYILGGSQKLVSNKEMAEELGIAPASVTEMLAKLQKEGLIDYIPYKGSRLTREGLESCVELVRSHRLWEVFLIRHLGYSWSEAHEDAHLLEHAAPARMVERLDRFLNHPATCPHGSAIPQGEGFAQQPPLRTLWDLEAGEEGVVRRVSAEKKELLDHLQSLGVALGCRMRVLSKASGPQGEAVRVELEGRTVAIGGEAARKLCVSPPDRSNHNQ